MKRHGAGITRNTILGGMVASLFVAGSPAAATSGVPCDRLKELKIDHVAIDTVDSHATGPYTALDGQQLGDLPAFCRLHGTAVPVEGSRIGFELWLPESDWNGKLEMFGNGGYSSKIGYGSLGDQLKRGYTVVGTDTGHNGEDPDFAVGHPEAIVDWGHRAVHESAVAAKAIVAARYGQAAKHAYFSGCSTGGHQAFMEAQRYPTDFDGIIAGDPGHNRTHLNAGFLWQFVANRGGSLDAAAIVPPAKLAVVSSAVIKTCRGHDGGLATDKFLTDPEACGFKPGDLLCKAGDQPDCLTDAEAGALEAMYRGAHDPVTGEAIYYAWPKGSENSGRVIKSLPGWSLYWADPAHPEKPARSNFWKVWAFDDPNWDWKSFDFDRGMKAVDDKLAATINAMNPDLSAFRAARGKMIQYHGLADPVVPPRDSIDYYESVQRATAGSRSAPVDQTSDFYRLFLVPGMEHCRGGEGPNVLDTQRALEDWVEQDKAPARIMATKFLNDSPVAGVAMTRPLCPYPAIARHDGRGDPNDAANFVCVEGHRYAEPLTSPTYRR